MSGQIDFMLHLFPAKPTFTEDNLPDLQGKVCIVTGGNSGVGKEISHMLYANNAKVYMAARSEAKAHTAIEDIKAAIPNSRGQLIYLHLDLADLNSVKVSAREFLAREQRLDVLFNNAGLGFVAQGSKTEQGYELQLGVNCIGHFLFTEILSPTLAATAKTAPHNSVRVVWASSSAGFLVHPTHEVMDNLDYHKDRPAMDKYAISKLGNYLYATEYGRRHKADGIVSTPINPGNLDSELWRTQPRIWAWIMRHTILYPSVYGAYTSLWAGFSPDVTVGKSGTFVAPWGKFRKVSKQMLAASKDKAEGGTGVAKRFWEWTGDQVRPYL